MNFLYSKEKDNIREVLRIGSTSEFWNILTQTLSESILKLARDLEDEKLADLPSDEYKITSEIIKAKKKNLEKLLDMPQTLIDWLEKSSEEDENPDPYDDPLRK